MAFWPYTNINDWYYIVGDTNPTTRVFSTARGLSVVLSDASFLAWLTAGNQGERRGILGAANNGAGLARLQIDDANGLQTGQVFAVSGTGAYDQNWTITAVDSTHVDLQGSTFSASVSSGYLQGATIIDTQAHLLALINAAALGNYLTGASFANGVDTHGGLAAGTTLTLTNPLASATLISFNADGTNKVQLPAMNLPSSIPKGVPFLLVNNGTHVFEIDTAGGAAFLSVAEWGMAYEFISIDNSTAAGNFKITARPLVFGSAAIGTVLAGDSSGPLWRSMSLALDDFFSPSQGDILYRDASSWARLGAGTSGEALTTLGASANPAWGSALRSKTVSFTRDISTATGTQAVTGVGFKPTSVTFFMIHGGNAAASWGFADSAKSGACSWQSDPSKAINDSNVAIEYINDAATNIYTGDVSSYDTDGFTISWTKTGTPSGTATIKALCLR